MMKQFFIWLFQDFLYKLYDLAESKFTLHIETLDAFPPGGPLLPIGQVGTPYTLSPNYLYANGQLGDTLPIPWRPLKFAITSGSLPNGLGFSSTSPLLSAPFISPYTLGTNAIDILGIPTLAGDFLFSLKWTTSEEIPQNVTRNYRIRIEANQETGLVEIVENLFSCAMPPPPPPKRKKSLGLGGYPVICCDPKRHLLTGKIIPCPERIKTAEGVYYYKISEDPRTGRSCYARNDFRVVK